MIKSDNSIKKISLIYFISLIPLILFGLSHQCQGYQPTADGTLCRFDYLNSNTLSNVLNNNSA